MILLLVGVAIVIAYWAGHVQGASVARRDERERCVGVLLGEMNAWDLADVNRHGKLIREIEKGQLPPHTRDVRS